MVSLPAQLSVIDVLTSCEVRWKSVLCPLLNLLQQRWHSPLSPTSNQIKTNSSCSGQTYSLASISKWFTIRKSSPLTGLPMAHTDLRPHTDLAQEVNRWTQSDDLIAVSSSGLATASDTSGSKRRRTDAVDVIDVNFTSSSATFKRSLPKTLTTKDLYKVAFRGMRARHTNFLLLNGATRIAPSPVATLASRGITAEIQIQIFPEGQMTSTNPDACLVKIFQQPDRMLCAFWTTRWTANSLRLVLIKYWRFRLKQYPHNVVSMAVWSNMRKAGDGQQIGSAHTVQTSLSQVLSRSSVPGILGHESVTDVAEGTRDENDDSTDEEDEEDEDTADTSVTVLKLYVCGKGGNNGKRPTLSRLDVVKQTFESLVLSLIHI